MRTVSVSRRPRRRRAVGAQGGSTSSSIAIQPIRSSTVPRGRRSSPRGPPSWLRDARAHRPRRDLRLARVRARGEVLRRAGDHRRGGDAARGAHVTLLVETRAGYANLCRLLTAAHAGTRLPGRESELLPPALDLELLAEHNDGLVYSPAAHGRGSGCSTRTAPPARTGLRPERFFVELQRPYERGTPPLGAAPRILPSTWRRDGRHRQRPCSPPPRGCGCRTCSSPFIPARRSTAASASGAKPRVGAPAAGGDARASRPARSWGRRAQCRAG